MYGAEFSLYSAKLRAKMGEANFLAQYQQRPVPLEETSDDLARVEAGAALYASQVQGFQQQLSDLAPTVAPSRPTKRDRAAQRSPAIRHAGHVYTRAGLRHCRHGLRAPRGQ